MNASMSSRRIGLHENNQDAAAYASVLAFAVGIILSTIAVKANVSWLAIPGFVAIAGSAMYWNLMFWARFYGKRPKR